MILINLRFRKPWQWTQWRQVRQFQESMRDRASPFVKKLGPSTSRPRQLAPDAHTMSVTAYVQGNAFSRGHLFKLQSVCGSDPLIHPMSGSPTQHSPRRRSMDPSHPLVAVARIAHEANRAYCEALGDFSQPRWEQAPAWQKESAVKGVQFHNANPTATPADSHESWLKVKQEEGWKYGPIKDPEKKEHPCFMPYDQLPIEQRAKDFIFRGVVHAVLTSALTGV